ncbi:hypothetical protein C8R43DRAFT_947370 [Mycena crocata]|nr:hypothetical protein C8R43DRAFT_947370 [Mycena crocata]
MHEPAHDTEFCRGPAAGDGCSGSFPRKTTQGLCHRCLATENADTDEGKQRIMECSQCLDCGMFAKHMTNNKCGACHREDINARAEKAKSVAQQTRPMAWQARMAGPLAPPQPARNLVPTTAATRMINVHLTPFIKNKRYMGVGTISLAYDEQKSFEEIIGDTLKSWGSTWDATHSTSLRRSELLPLWHGFLTLHDNSTFGTLGEFYDIHSRLHNREVFLTIPAKNRAEVKQPVVVLSIIINEEAFNQRTATKNVHKGTAVKRGRSDDDDEEPLAKRAAASAPLTSKFTTLRSRVEAPRTATDVELEFIKVNYNGDVGSVFPWPGETKVKGRLFDKPFKTGKDWAVYELEINNTLYVAKRSLSSPKDATEFFDNETRLSCTVIALSNAKILLKEFYGAADKIDILEEIDGLLAVQEAFIATELISDAHRPSVASGVSQDNLKTAVASDYVSDPLYNNFPPPSERQHIKSMEFDQCRHLPDAKSKFGTTATALSHFVANFVQNQAPDAVELLSHFQTANAKLPSNEYGKLIFDVIFQNRSQDSGLAGIGRILDAHVCNRVCQLMELNQDDDEEDE